MQIHPQQNYLLCRIHDIASEVVLPEGMQREPYGEVLAVGPDCRFTKPGDNILFMPSALLIRFDEGRFIVSEGSIFAKCDPEAIQAGAVELEIVKNPADAND